MVRFQNFYKAYPYLLTQELIEYFSVFDGLDARLYPDENILENITNIYLKGFSKIKQNFIYTEDESLQKDIQYALTRLARGNRKRYSIYKDLPQNKGKKVYSVLFDQGIITEELSREKPIRTHKLIKKSLRHYTIENKIRFANESTRFWFAFIAPFEEDIKCDKYENALNYIKLHLDKHISLSFEMLSEELMKKKLKQKIQTSGSFWDKNFELDLLIQTENGQVIVGEAKWKNTKICKNVLNSLFKKAQMLHIKADFYAFFSKSGFSKEVLNLKNDRLLLYDIEDFEGLLR